MRTRLLSCVLLVALGTMLFPASGFAVCTEDTLQTCRLGTLKCIRRNCASTTPEDPIQYRECRAPCYAALLRCRAENFCQ